MLYNLYDMQERLAKNCSVKRYQHMLSTAYLAVSLAMCYGEDSEPAFLAGLLHDCAKHLSDAELLSNCKEQGIAATEYEMQNPSLLHAKVGACLAEHQYGVKDKSVLDAIRYHVNGRPDMTFIEKAVYVADYLEIWRGHLSSKEGKTLRRMAFCDIDQAVYRISDKIIQHVSKKSSGMDTMPYEVRDFYRSPSKWRNGWKK